MGTSDTVIFQDIHHTHTHTHTHTHAGTQIHSYAHTYIHTYTNAHMDKCTNTNIYIYIYIYIYTCAGKLYKSFSGNVYAVGQTHIMQTKNTASCKQMHIPTASLCSRRLQDTASCKQTHIPTANTQSIGTSAFPPMAPLVVFVFTA